MISATHRALAAGAGLLLATPTVDAQLAEGARLEFGALASFTRFDDARLPFSNDFGAGIRAGWYVNRTFSIEALVTRTMTQHLTAGALVDVAELGATALATFPFVGSNRVYVGVGYGIASHSGWSSFSDQAPHVVFGDRIPLSRMAALRLEGRAVLTAGSNAPPTPGGRATNIIVSLGVSFFAREMPPRDSDSDQIPDRFDRCASTPSGLLVDATGCPRDTDGDGVFDGLDRCPATDEASGVDEQGCALDSDGDGVPNQLDRCSGTQAGMQVETDGCPPDADRDGVPDVRDRCADTPADARVAATGCPLDSDDDGVPDHLDRCPNTAADQAIDEVGCPVLFEEVAGERQPLVLRGVNFELGQAVLTPESFAILEQVAASLVVHVEVRAEVAGHTDALGTEALNRALSLARAETVRGFLVSRGVAAERLLARGYGTSQPAASNSTDEGRARNRRVELRLIEP